MRLSYFFIFMLLSVIFMTLFAYADENPLTIQLIGLEKDKDILKNAQERLQISQKSFAHMNDAEIKTFFLKAPEQIRHALEPFGYFKPQINSQLLHPSPSKWIAIFHIQLGPPLRITNIHIKITGDGENNSIIQDAIQHFPLQKNQIFNAVNYENAKENLFQIVTNQGYLKAVFEKKEIQIDLRHYTAQIELILNTGTRYYFGPVYFNSSPSTSNPLSTDFLKRFIPFEPNQAFSSNALLNFQQNLQDSHYFKTVAINPDFQHPIDHQIPLNVDLTLPKTQQYNIGLGYGTFTGPRLTWGTQLRRITPSGHRFNLQLKLSSALKGLAAKYFIPGRNPLTDQYTVGANIQEFKPKNGNSFSETLTAGYEKTFKAWQHTLTLNLLNERYTADNEPRRNSHLLYPAWTVSHTTTDNLIYPHQGHIIRFILRGASENIFSTTNFAQAEIKGKFIISPTTVSRVIFRGDLGYTVVHNLNDFPLTLRYFAGGLGSVRGFADTSIGPGRYLEIVSAEYQHKIIENWNAAIFYDVGTATNHFNTQINRGAGVGVVYHSLIGPIQIYLARAESKPGKPFSIEFSIGPDF